MVEKSTDFINNTVEHAMDLYLSKTLRQRERLNHSGVRGKLSGLTWFG
jgi:hypothetical protein